ncbi:Argininosuccinate lyase [Folsomia candida]|uniref:Argininosuccinate lyase n=1 Tax=Folsomia candida TaxID=158441 RepID=A0A226D783_FOLCA|nr:Argininosuccinate lyase [Folsomia candida]
MVNQPTPDDGDSQSASTHGLSDPVASFMSNVLGDDSPSANHGLKRRSQTIDAEQQFIQQSISRSLISQAKTAQILFENANKIPGNVLKLLLHNVMDGATQNATAHYEISIKRRQSIKPHLTQDCVGICNNSSAITELLFGSNLEKDLSLAKSSSKIIR